MKKRLLWLRASGVVFLAPVLVFADPPTDPKSLAIYNHDKEWLSHFPSSFIATNIRGEDRQYAERREAALDLLKEHSDKTAIPELMEELRRGSFLSSGICGLLGEWKAKEAVPLLQEVQADKKRPKEVREKAAEALQAIAAAPAEDRSHAAPSTVY